MGVYLYCNGGDVVTEMCISAANYIIEKVNEYNKRQTNLRDQIFMSSKRLQKLLFFSNVLYMIENRGDSMIEDDFFAWPSGPVIPSVYDIFMQYQDGDMNPHDIENHTLTDNIMKNVIDRVFADTTALDTKDMINKSHIEGSPWWTIYEKNKCQYGLIAKNIIYDYYSKQGAPYGMRNVQ